MDVFLGSSEGCVDSHGCVLRVFKDSHGCVLRVFGGWVDEGR